ncbi:MAG: hypothetical protein D6753_03115 [Planctomycetota bacterium]|nr:MAG: hypothetical protein D6753_03115 [Planctomycetota bacterium]
MRRRLHESTSRWLSQLALLVLAILPSAGVVAYCAWAQLPWYGLRQRSHWQSLVSSACGLNVRIDAAEALAPHATLLRGVELLHPETNATLAEVSRVRVQQVAGQWLLEVGEVRIAADDMDVAWQAVEPFLLQRPGRTAVVSLAAHQVVVAGHRGTQCLADFQLALLPDAAATRLSMQFRLTTADSDRALRKDPLDQGHEGAALRGEVNDSGDADLARINIMRLHRDADLPTLFQLRTGATPLPCTLLEPFWPTVKAFGEKAAVLGIADFRRNQQGWRLMVDDRGGAEHGLPVHQTGGLLLQDVDFAALPWKPGMGLTGQGWIWIGQGVVGAEGIELLRGGIRCGPGRISQQLLASLARELFVQVDAGLRTASVAMVPYEQGIFHYQIAPSSVRLAGAMDGGAMLVDGQGVLAARADWQSAIPLTNLAQALDQVLVRNQRTGERNPLGRLAGGALVVGDR